MSPSVQPYPLQLKLFGSPQITFQGQPLTGFVSAKVRALLIYLAVTARPHSRDHLAELLWADTPASTRTNLRKALSNLRQLIGNILVEDGKESIALDVQQVWVDLGEFERLIKQGNERTAIELYQADFLTDLDAPPCENFEGWVLEQQIRLKDVMTDALRQLTYQYAESDQLPGAIRTVRRFLQMEPWHEEAHRWLMMLLAKNGQRCAIQAHFALCQKLIQEELNAELSTKTIALFHTLVSATEESELDYLWDKLFPPPTPAQLANTPFIAGPPITQPHLFLGRDLELNRIFGWWRTVPMAHVALICPRRSGKTSLLRYLQTISTTASAALRLNQKRNWLPNRVRTEVRLSVRCGGVGLSFVHRFFT